MIWKFPDDSERKQTDMPLEGASEVVGQPSTEVDNTCFFSP